MNNNLIMHQPAASLWRSLLRGRSFWESKSVVCCANSQRVPGVREVILWFARSFEIQF